MKIVVHSSYSYVQKVNNYGSLLQYFALQEFLRKLGHNVYWLRLNLKWTAPTGINRILREVILHSNFKLSKMEYHNQEGFDRFIERFIFLTASEYTTEKELRSNLEDADIYIVGSDQVWNGYSGVRFLNYVPEKKKKISYAVSFGRHNIPWYMRPLLYYYLKSFNAISIREKIGVDICHSLFRKDAVHAIDPTFLLSRKDYESYISKDHSLANLNKRYIYGYFVNPFPEDKICYKTEIDSFVNSQKLDFVVTGIQNAEKALSEYEQIQPSPLEWINHIMNASAVLTNSFHGVAFSINLNIPFLFLPQEGSMSNQNGRHMDLLCKAGLKDRVYCPQKGSLEEQMLSDICWDSVNKNIEQFKKQSIEFLLSQLSE